MPQAPEAGANAPADTTTPGEAIPAPADGTPVMLRSPDAELVEALAAAQAAFPAIEKKNTAEVRGKDGKAGYSYTYADLAEVLAVVRPVLAANGLAVTQRTVREQGKIILLTELRHRRGGIIVSEVEVGQSSGNPQQFGGALTYLRRYELVTLVGVAAEEDRDAQDVVPPGRDAPAAALPPWALEANPRRKAELRAGLTVLLDGDRSAAEGIGKAMAAGIGHVPDVVVGLVNGIITTREAKAQAVRDAQDQAAEDPELADAPPDAGLPAEDPPPASPGKAPTEEELARAEAYRREQAAGEEVDGELERDLEAEANAAPAPGTVPAPPRTGDVETDVANLRDLGCNCEGPLADADVPGAHEDNCPVHGIPF